MFIHKPTEEMWLGGIGYFPTDIVQFTLGIYDIKEYVLKQCSKVYASGGNVATSMRITGLPKTWGQERE